MSQIIDNKGAIVIYQTPDGVSELDVRLENETVWLTQAQMVALFGRDQSVLSRHINNVFKENELDVKSNMQILHIANSDKPVAFYNLDVIISVGYRIKSQRGTQFRIWANKVLKDYIVKGYAINNKLKNKQYEDLKQTVKLLSNVIQNKALTGDEATGLLRIITDYTYALDTLDKYDYQQLMVDNTSDKEKFHATYEHAMDAIEQLKSKFDSSDLFANEKDQSFKSSINTIYQTFDGKDLYPSIEEKAAMLLYLVTKNHSFSDGIGMTNNKRQYYCKITNMCYRH
ncbi:MAG: virulence RhuM family protein [Candidatus Symbiothrix sp.]|jgi:hypothetical protein|nr:virulence RhuM family protein [Candidatus Symbiothrix sp.]